MAAAAAQGRRAPRGAAVPSGGGSGRTSGRRADGRPGAMGRAPRPGQRDAACGKTPARCGRGSCSSSWRRICATACGRMFKNRAFTALAALSLALGIGANTAIYSFMDAILLRSLPVPDPASLVVVNWRSRPFNCPRRTDVRDALHRRQHLSTTPRASQRPFSRSRRSSACRRHRRRSSPASSRTTRPAT